MTDYSAERAASASPAAPGLTMAQLNALRNYITERCDYMIERRLNPYMPPADRFSVQSFEAQFEEIMLASVSGAVTRAQTADAEPGIASNPKSEGQDDG